MARFAAYTRFADLTSDQVLTLQGSQRFGFDLGVGDWNNDGFNDLIVTQADARWVHVFNGTATGIAPNFWFNSPGHHMHGIGINQLASATFIGDTNNDGFDDILFGSPNYSRSSGVAALQYGIGSGGAVTGNDFPGVANQRLGATVAGLGDINNDGFDDFAIGAPGSGIAGAAMIYLGQAGAGPQALAMTITFGESTDRFGGFIEGLGDIDNDGFDDFAVGGAGALGGTGVVAVIYGAATFPATLSAALAGGSLDGANGYTLAGVSARDGLSRVAGLGDINADGFADFAVSAPAADIGGEDSGTVYVVFGSGVRGAPPNIANLNGTNGFTLNGSIVASELGSSITHGDLNNDGVQDLIVTAPANSAIHVLYGHAGAFNASYSTAELDGANGFTIAGIAEMFTGALTTADMNADGIDDLIVGAQTFNGTGMVAIIYGRAWGLTWSARRRPTP